MSEYFNQFFNGESKRYSLVVEDDGKVCYAYLLLDSAIIGDVWIYNQFETPLETNWANKNEMPFLNPKEYVQTKYEIKPILNDDEIRLKWFLQDENRTLNRVEIWIRGVLTAIITQNSKPGWSINVKKDGPLAKILNNE